MIMRGVGGCLQSYSRYDSITMINIVCVTCLMILMRSKTGRIQYPETSLSPSKCLDTPSDLLHQYPNLRKRLVPHLRQPATRHSSFTSPPIFLNLTSNSRISLHCSIRFRLPAPADTAARASWTFGTSPAGNASGSSESTRGGDTPGGDLVTPEDVGDDFAMPMLGLSGLVGRVQDGWYSQVIPVMVVCGVDGDGEDGEGRRCSCLVLSDLADGGVGFSA
ncbi:uncharacterized protein BO80DRAFT_814 [Aspergillus ibericus CBS 121593]|uniref:Uncharacterized protein n=1 Tax=Aspergillus ibericus CBS 121593 TaxID=1448316 RepID=A0A395HE03_9EURO|nr:hypothetical protein BO80DRAFT_814 [Aspergillus ibericus CBS 121593]RAL06082.1 hypothetical protein BO80DRAFT_814 [Aspergillus ibericus CBS 121593]